MNTLNTLVLVAHVLIAASIIGLVMLQKGKGADAGAGFGAGASGTVFGARGSANFLSRSTAVAAALFFASSLGLAYLNRDVEVSNSLLDSAVTEELPADVVVMDSAADDADFELPALPDVEMMTQPESAGEAELELPPAPEAAQ
ncbi:MAG: preprotein translocase subunit SecG [Gammaproteobacteria bacterium]|nr:preprotein translocase subunit SecG [Gammaproteobacteria bacterium]NND54153.1 preprotein translocase subunit SecG [Gammaproteobacteria bacterium]